MHSLKYWNSKKFSCYGFSRFGQYHQEETQWINGSDREVFTEVESKAPIGFFFMLNFLLKNAIFRCIINHTSTFIMASFLLSYKRNMNTHELRTVCCIIKRRTGAHTHRGFLLFLKPNLQFPCEKNVFSKEKEFRKK